MSNKEINIVVDGGMLLISTHTHYSPIHPICKDDAFLLILNTLESIIVDSLKDDINSGDEISLQVIGENYIVDIVGYIVGIINNLREYKPGLTVGMRPYLERIAISKLEHTLRDSNLEMWITESSRIVDDVVTARVLETGDKTLVTLSSSENLIQLLSFHTPPSGFHEGPMINSLYSYSKRVPNLSGYRIFLNTDQTDLHFRIVSLMVDSLSIDDVDDTYIKHLLRVRTSPDTFFDNLKLHIAKDVSPVLHLMRHSLCSVDGLDF